MLQYFKDHPKTSWLGLASLLTAGAGVATSLGQGQAVDYKSIILGVVVGLIGLFSADAKKPE